MSSRSKVTREIVSCTDCAVCMLIAAGHHESAMFVRGFVMGMQRISHASREVFCELHAQAVDEAIAAMIGNGLVELPVRVDPGQRESTAPTSPAPACVLVPRRRPA